MVLATVATLEQVDQGGYDHQPETADTGMRDQERSHARVLRYIAGASPQGVAGETLAKLEGRHRAPGGNSLRAAILGANDGLTSNLALVMGVAGARLTTASILITGLSGLLAGSFSMAIGEWVSVQSARELYGRQVRTEAAEIRTVPDEEQEELALIYEAKGLPQHEAEQVAERLMADEQAALDAMVREELGLDPNQLGGSPYAASSSSFFLFAVGALIPLIPYFAVRRNGCSSGIDRLRCSRTLRHRGADHPAHWTQCDLLRNSPTRLRTARCRGHVRAWTTHPHRRGRVNDQSASFLWPRDTAGRVSG